MKVKSEQDYAIVYHGTNSHHAKNIQKHGFKLDKKTRGATSELHNQTGITDAQSSKYHYVTTSIIEAAKYAKIHENPVIVRVVCLKKWLDRDPEADSDTAFRIKDNISHSLVLPRNPNKMTIEKARKISKKLSGKEDIAEDFLKKLKDSVRSTVEDDRVIEQVVSPVQEALAVSQKELEKIKKITGGEFKEGEIFSLDPEDLE